MSLDDLVAVLGKPVSDEQAAVVTAPLEAGVVVAGAGSGKTATMVARVVWLVGSGLVAPDRVLGLTFTTKAADELAVRVRSGLRRLRAAGRLPALAADHDAEPGDLEPTVSTYHAFAARLVRDHALRLGREPGARLITPATSWQLASRAVGSYDGPMEAVGWAESTVVQAVLALAGDLAEHLVEPDAVREVGRRLQDTAAGTVKLLSPARKVLACAEAREQLLPIVDRYAALKRDRELLDFGDVVALAAELARDCADVREVERAASRVVLLDEYQDTGAAQEVLLSHLFGDGHPVTAVGDPCQSIYGWRGASAGTLRRFPSSFGAPPERRPARSAPPTAAGAASSGWPTGCPTSCAPRASRCPGCAPRRAASTTASCGAHCCPTSRPRRRGSPTRSSPAWPACRRRRGRPGRARRSCAASGRCSPGCGRPSRPGGCRSRSSAWAGCSPSRRSPTCAPRSRCSTTPRPTQRCCGC
jgi:hypothetical protein